MKPIMSRYVVPCDLKMISALGEQGKINQWDYAIDKNNCYWFWPSQSRTSGEMIHVGSIQTGKKSDGYGGRTLDFSTKDGVISIQGPWHSNSDALYEATGVDLRDRHLTWGVISEGRGHDDSNRTVMLNVLFVDPIEGVIGTFDRITDLAQKIADEVGREIYYYRRSFGGSSCGPVYPTGKAPWEITTRNKAKNSGKI